MAVRLGCNGCAISVKWRADIGGKAVRFQWKRFMVLIFQCFIVSLFHCFIVTKDVFLWEKREEKDNIY
jgi:hypothetical protein